jgi:hypothetical protein
MMPHARQDNLLVREVGDELVVYDQERHRAHRLNRTATLVWRRCDGQTTVAEMAALLQSELNLVAVDEGLVWLALDRLEKAHLLRPWRRPAKAAGITRRQVARQLAGTAAVALLPVVATLVAPTPALAQSPVADACIFKDDCESVCSDKHGSGVGRKCCQTTKICTRTSALTCECK